MLRHPSHFCKTASHHIFSTGCKHKHTHTCKCTHTHICVYRHRISSRAGPYWDSRLERDPRVRAAQNMGLKKKGSDGWMDGWSDGQRTRDKSERQRDQKGGRRETERERAAENMRLKCNVLERQRESANPGQVMQLGGTAHWQNVARIKKRRRQQTLFSIASLLISSYSPIRQQERNAAYITLHLKHNKPSWVWTKKKAPYTWLNCQTKPKKERSVWSLAPNGIGFNFLRSVSGIIHPNKGPCLHLPFLPV